MNDSHHMAIVNGVQIHFVIGGHGDPVFYYTDGRQLGMNGTK